ncbi:hypothetical protein ACFPZ0_12210 [Streptomonospora nanhaiensis]|uniref:hypothetical protein n=1 Tax=Streptomonospora nanhaiensis TaxID=1323731 RepID=UPI0015CC8FBB|nr:hypothetical protein [Streptomonospora nanhaiensis]MBV2364349.1 hypothetical protein [Streptomonospora nanhaiensis]MBX9389618.1 hypothetical protein [Streptomonospora nanhaiensis]
MPAPLRDRAQTACRAAFTATLLVFLALATALVATQAAGVLLLRPDWVTAASDALLVPSITAAVAFGLVGFVSGYVMPKSDGSAD